MLPAIRPICEADEPQVAQLIRTVMPEFGASGPGFAIHDPEVNEMFRAYSRPRCAYFVLTHESRVVGGGGVAPLEGAGEDADVCELRKMYFLPEARGQGLGQAMMERCLQAAMKLGFQRCYLETLVAMQKARALYLRNGFRLLEGPLGNTGHFSCDAWYLKDLR